MNLLKQLLIEFYYGLRLNTTDRKPLPIQLTDQEVLNRKCHEYLTSEHH